MAARGPPDSFTTASTSVASSVGAVVGPGLAGEPGAFDLMIGASSADIRLRATVTVTGPLRRIEGGWRMESGMLVEP